MEKHEAGYFEKTELLVQHYIQNRLTLLKLKGTEKIAKLVSVMAIFIFVLLLVFLILLFISIMGGYYFAELTGSLFIGFGIVSGIYLFLLLLVLLVRKKYLDPFITDTVVRILMDKTAEHEEQRNEGQE